MGRVEGVDVIRTAAIFAVIVIHTTPFENPAALIGRELDLATVINQFMRFAVPFFFVLSGYFWAGKFRGGADLVEPTIRMAQRIALLFLAWSAIYLLPINIIDSFSYGPIGPVKVAYWNLANAARAPLVTLLQGTKVHLWFLMGLLWSLLISAVFIRFRLERLLFAFAVVLYLVGVAGKAYSNTPMGFHSTFNFRNGPFFATIFFVTGYFLQRRSSQARWLQIGYALFFVGIVFHFGELVVLNKWWRTSMNQDYVIGTYFFGVGSALVALSNPNWLRMSRMASIGPLVLGIFTSHYLFIELLTPVDRRLNGVFAWDVFYTATVFVLSYLLSLALSRHHITKRLVV